VQWSSICVCTCRCSLFVRVPLPVSVLPPPPPLLLLLLLLTEQHLNVTKSISQSTRWLKTTSTLATTATLFTVLPARSGHSLFSSSSVHQLWRCRSGRIGTFRWSLMLDTLVQVCPTKTIVRACIASKRFTKD